MNNISKNLKWSIVLLIYCLENGSKDISRYNIAKSLGLSIDEYNTLTEFLEYSGVYKLANKYIKSLSN